MSSEEEESSDIDEVAHVIKINCNAMFSIIGNLRKMPKLFWMFLSVKSQCGRGEPLRLGEGS